MSTNPAEGWSSGQFVRATKALPAVEVDGSSWESDIPEEQWASGRFVPVSKALPAVEVDCSTCDAEPAVWLELVISFEQHTPPAAVMQHVNSLLTVVHAADPGLGLTYDFQRSRLEGEKVILALSPANGAGTEKRMEDVLTAVNPEILRLAGPNPTAARLVREAGAA